MESKLRIIAGKWRSRQLAFEESLGLRPTPARTRETLFNWLQQDVARSQCLDLFAGSGALGFEAASRGADSVTMVEENANACRLIKQNIDKLSAQQVNIVKSDVFKFLVADASPFNLVFLDPPFTQGLAQQTCHWLEDKGWLTVQAKIYIEVESRLVLDDMPENWHCLKNKKAGQVAYYLFQRN
ncbi:MAG: 16S rRNA (guanine(966)-N(2))-methyltransferase RsmD [Methylococcales symbiont of Hymedesmia sp. n. MRB-2018]|nr:MAG: 16S rRNA (guanine(966)-N(2))-methyltransferase RsmD [Methylococcales symbiont of Hymedesmia sp. n. MRB-2018]